MLKSDNTGQNRWLGSTFVYFDSIITTTFFDDFFFSFETICSFFIQLLSHITLVLFKQVSFCSHLLISTSLHNTKYMAFHCVNISSQESIIWTSCLLLLLRNQTDSLPLRVAHISAAINYLMRNTEYISFSITDLLRLVKYIVAVYCSCASPLCFTLAASHKSLISRATSNVASAPAQLKWSGKCSFVYVNMYILWHCLCMTSGFHHQNTFFTG